MRITRRSFLAGSAAATTLPALSGATIAGTTGAAGDEILIYVFLRGGIDGLSVYAPGSGHPDRGFYESLRPSLSVRLPTSGPNAMIPLADGFGLNSAAAPLHDLWTQGDLAIVHATGLPIVNRSHFEAERYIELGTPGATEGLPPGQQIDGVRTTSTGWLTRHLASATNLPPTMTMPVVATESQVPLSLTNEPTAVTLRYPGDFDLALSGSYEEAVEDAMAAIYAADGSDIGVAGEQAWTAQSLVESIFVTSNSDYNNALGQPYPLNENGNLYSISDKLITLARLIKSNPNLGLRIAQIDYGGWDDHTTQGSLPSGVNGSSGRYYDRLDVLSRAVNAFWADMAGQFDAGTDRRGRITIVFHSEFGRRAFNNADDGTDHGSGNLMMLLGGNVNGGQFHGEWPGMGPDDLYQNADLRTTNDFRRILSEVLIRRLGNHRLGEVFPFYYNYQPLGVVNGTDILPDYRPHDDIKADGFE